MGKDEIEVTAEMIAAGATVLAGSPWFTGLDSIASAVAEEVVTAALRARYSFKGRVQPEPP
jgi:hypothetical protein